MSRVIVQFNLSFISKVIKRIVASQLTGYLQMNRLLPDHQSVYRQGHSTETALLKISSDILDAADSAQVTLLGLLEPERCLLHCRPRHPPDKATKVIRRMTYGVGGIALAWISSFIQGRQQSVTFNGHQSTWIQLKYGVPQGWVLGPTLFLLYTSDIISIGVGAYSYADNSQLYLHCLATDQSTAALRLAECIERVEGWMKSNRLKLNSDETQSCGSRQQLAKIDIMTMTIGEHRIESSTSAKNLGVTFDSELGMDSHVNNITRSCFYQLRQLRSIRRSLSTDAVKTLVFLSYQVVSTTATVFFTVNKHCCETTSICPQRGCQADLEQEEVRPYHSCVEGPTLLASHPSAYRLQDRGLRPATPSMVEVRHTSAAPAILSERSAPGLICDLLCGATRLCLEPRPVASGLEVSVSPDRLFGTHCPRT